MCTLLASVARFAIWPSKYLCLSFISRRMPVDASPSRRSSYSIYEYGSYRDWKVQTTQFCKGEISIPSLLLGLVCGVSLDVLHPCIIDGHQRKQRVKGKTWTYKAEFNSRSECSLNLRIKGRAPFCRPACIVISFSLPV